MAPPSLWSGNLRISLVLIPVRLVPAVSTEEVISFRQIHEPSGTPIRQVKGVRDGDTFTEVPDEEIIKGYEYAKGSHVLIDPKEIDDLKLEAKHTIDMVRFVDEGEIDTRYWEKPYYLVPDGDEADEGYAIMHRDWEGRHRPTHPTWASAPRSHQSTQRRLDAVHPPLCRRITRSQTVLRGHQLRAPIRSSRISERVD